MNNLISGSSSGLGRFLLENLQGDKLTRNIAHPYPRCIYSSIIHCAWPKDYEYNYINNITQLTDQLILQPHKKFIFLSSIDVYPKNKAINTENDRINPNDILGLYGVGKFLIEELIKARCENYLILRCGAFLGKYTPDNNIRRVSEGRDASISCESKFNIITYEQILDFIKLGLEKDLTGIYNIVAKNNIKLIDLDGIGMNYGEYLYQTPKISYEKLLTMAPQLCKSSIKNFGRWIK